MNEQKILMTQGLPGSGKSTWAKEMLKRFPGEYKRVNRDELRLMVDDGKWSRQNEKTIVDLEERLIVQALASGFSVIIDDTNMASKTVARWRQVASQAGVALETQDFTQVPLATCIAWDLRRANSVGAGVIRRMYEQYIFEEIIPVEHDAGKQDVVMCDIDGTLAKHNRSPHDYAKLGTDSLIAPIKEALLRLRHVREGEELPVIIMSGRPADYRAETKEWLTRHEIPYLELHMRPSEDFREDSVVKGEMFRDRVLPYYNVLWVLDDRDRVVEMWRRLGLTCLQVAEGAF